MSRTVLVEADLSLKESTQGATEQALTPASTTLKPDKLAIIRAAKEQARAQSEAIEAQHAAERRAVWLTLEESWQRDVQAKLRALAPFTEAVSQQSALWLSSGVLSALGSAAGGMGGFVSAAGDMGGIGRLSEIRTLGINSAEILKAITVPSAFLESAALRSIADFGALERLRSFAPDIAAPRPAPSTRAPAVPHAPEPPAAEIAEVHLPGERWAEVITVAIREGKATKAEVQRLLMSMPDQAAPGVKPPLWEEIEAAALLYKEHGHKYDNQECFVRHYLTPKGMAISVQTFRRWIKQYETVTGESIGPGQGSRKRKLPSRGM